jgi:hypothetical protein
VNVVPDTATRFADARADDARMARLADPVECPHRLCAGRSGVRGISQICHCGSGVSPAERRIGSACGPGPRPSGRRAVHRVSVAIARTRRTPVNLQSPSG